MVSPNQSGAAEAWWAHNPQVPGSKPGSDKSVVIFRILFFSLIIKFCLFVPMRVAMPGPLQSSPLTFRSLLRA
ncbi:hypothetical protein PR202_gb09824 [Eleusine coracana subsp. coracana]|uniref:Uncharacterized protein n=1 Tax=Eleusine coracana subsp. coracana TaxID=191504 RepID=A0AAV5EJ20_ELECO|nr:hypothetical protein PR202_gb09824 [Eleusine coracana subsp. coracana]